MAKIRSCLALFLTYINILGTMALLGLLCGCLTDMRNDGYIRKLSQKEKLNPNLRGTKLKFNEIKEKINEITKKKKNYIPQDFNEEEFVLPNKQILNISSNKEIRKLYNYEDDFSDDEIIYALIADSIGIFFTFVLMFSFCLEKNECCDRNSQDDLGWCCLYCCLCCDCDCNCKCDNCDCKGGNGNDSAAGLLLLLIVLLIFVGIYYAIKAMGKHLSRYVSVVAEFLVDISIMILISMFDDHDTGECKDKFSLIYTVCGILACCNFLSLLIPNLSCGEYFRYGYRPGGTSTLVIENPSTPIVQTTAQVVVEKPEVSAPVYVTNPTYTPPVQAPPAYPQNMSLYPVQAPPNYPPNNGFNNPQGGIYNAPPSVYQPNVQPQYNYGNAPYPQ